ncbi:MAG TPA: DnaJ C-terminal domain-containing protein [Candidatus Paceibacterota bacterium]|nr:DnaJ C-terminal domain-containing protein [Candidatus Paceibacterota bacterium]HMP18746.1 DnaJ C-terminal domain-containing protein [Candidatus Paceibacterota bacterium]HMP85247.1 DnaJ C-terminal domain-containing protein [Candidatus Paceibacterota bacterium]
MNKDYYKILGIDKNASKEDIKKAFRKLAHQYHPDKKDGDEKKFKEINEAYNILSDDKKRAQYDQFGSGFSGFNGNNSGFSGADFGGFDFSNFSQNSQGFEFDINDILGSFFGGRGFSRAKKGSDISVSTEISFKESVFGVEKDIKIEYQNISKKENISIKIPPGIDSGEMLRVKGRGEPISDGYPGDLYVKIYVKPHKNLTKEGVNILTLLKIKLTESIIGTKKDVETVDEQIISVKIPPGIKHGEILRIKEKGVPTINGRRGDMFIKIEIEIPTRLSKKVKDALKMLEDEGF